MKRSTRNNNKQQSRLHEKRLLNAISDTTGHLPIMESVPVIHAGIFRFLVRTGQTEKAITFSNLAGMMSVATSATTLNGLFYFVKLKRVSLWTAAVTAATGSPLTPTFASVTYSGTSDGSDGSGQIFSDVAMGVSPLHVHAPTPKSSLASRYQNASDTGVAFYLTCGSGTIIDVEVVLRNKMGSPGGSGICVAAAPGAIYLRGLDSQPIASTEFTPFGAQASI